jgi:hypothetical protein
MSLPQRTQLQRRDISAASHHGVNQILILLNSLLHFLLQPQSKITVSPMLKFNFYQVINRYDDRDKIWYKPKTAYEKSINIPQQIVINSNFPSPKKLQMNSLPAIRA